MLKIIKDEILQACFEYVGEHGGLDDTQRMIEKVAREKNYPESVVREVLKSKNFFIG